MIDKAYPTQIPALPSGTSRMTNPLQAKDTVHDLVERWAARMKHEVVTYIAYLPPLQEILTNDKQTEMASSVDALQLCRRSPDLHASNLHDTHLRILHLAAHSRWCRCCC